MQTSLAFCVESSNGVILPIAFTRAVKLRPCELNIAAWTALRLFRSVARTYRWVVRTLLCPISAAIVKASNPASP